MAYIIHLVEKVGKERLYRIIRIYVTPHYAIGKVHAVQCSTSNTAQYTRYRTAQQTQHSKRNTPSTCIRTHTLVYVHVNFINVKSSSSSLIGITKEEYDDDNGKVSRRVI